MNKKDLLEYMQDAQKLKFTFSELKRLEDLLHSSKDHPNILDKHILIILKRNMDTIYRCNKWKVLDREVQYYTKVK